MASRSSRARAKGVGSLVDVGGTGYRSGKSIWVSRRGSLVTDQRAIGKDFRVAITKVVDQDPKRK